MIRGAARALILLPTIAWAAAPARYNDPPPAAPRAPLIARIDELAATLVPDLRADARLDAAAQTIAQQWPREGSPPNELVQGALWLQGVVEPSPQLLITRMHKGDDDALLQELGRTLPAHLQHGQYARVGAGIAAAGDEVRVVVALQETFVALEPVARALPLGAALALRGRLRGGVVKPEGFVTVPDGAVTALRLERDGERFGGSVRCGPARGRYQVELTADGRFGASVIANFPIFCGVPAPATLAALSPPAPIAADHSPSPPLLAEQEMLGLVNADRARAHLPPLAWDEALARVARAHSADMLQHHFVGHLSPTTGGPDERARRAGIAALLLSENLARASSVAEAERGLMSSPGHRANVLRAEVTRAGIGIADDPAAHERLFTQLFLRPPDPFDAHSVDELRRTLDALRRARTLAPLADNAALDALARTTARQMAQQGLSSQEAANRVGEALRGEASLHKTRALFFVVDALSQIVDGHEASFTDAGATDLGLAAEPGKRSDGSRALFVVVLVARAR